MDRYTYTIIIITGNKEKFNKSNANILLSKIRDLIMEYFFDKILIHSVLMDLKVEEA